MIQASKKLDHLTTSVFSELADKKAQKLKQNEDMIDLSIGSPDLPPAPFIKKSLAEEVMADDQYGYALSGTEEFKEAVTYYYRQRFGVTIDSDHVLQLMGSQDGLAHLSLAYLDPGDVVIVPDPGYPIYSSSVHIAGAEMYPVPLNEDNQFRPTLDDIPEDIRSRAKIMVLSYPGNPIPSLVEREYFEQVVAFAKQNNILIVHDFAYCELIFDGRKPISILSIPGAQETAIECNSLSKSFNMAGCRIGYFVGHPSLLAPLAVLKSHIDYGLFHPIQKTASRALTSDYTFLEEHRTTYEKRRNVFIDYLQDHGWNVRKPQGGMFVWAKIPEKWTSIDFSLAAIEHGVIVTPGHAFGKEGEGYVRIALVHGEERLLEAAKRLIRLVRSS